MSAARLVLYTGKGGVGKTTTAAATAVCAARRGLRTLVASADAAHSLGDVLERGLGAEPRRLAWPGSPGECAEAVSGAGDFALDAIEIDARAEMARHWGRIRDYLVSLFRYQGIEEVVAEELALLPGAEELTSLLAVEEHVTSGAYDLVVVDCAPTDTTLRLVTLPEVAHGALRWLLRLQQGLTSVVTPLARGVVPIPLPDAGVFRDAETLLYKKLRRLHRRVTDAGTSVRMVVTPERMVIDEARRAYTDLCLFDVPADAVVMNRLLPPEAAREPFFRDWVDIQAGRREEVARAFEPLRVLDAPLREDEVTGLESLARHGDELFHDCDPDAVLADAPRLRFERRAGGYLAHWPVPGPRPETLDVAKVEDELVVRVRDRRRAFVLPRRMAPLHLEGATWKAGELVISFAARPEGAAT
ncbi:MAG: TRC40/GET3/ArsA family transport-energizing ATPase [Myxococcota bacterium]